MSNDFDSDILLVEDNVRDAELTLWSLKKRHLHNRVVRVKDGEEALEYIFGPDTDKAQAIQHVPKVILLDLKLPKVDGREVLVRLKSDERTKRIPVVVLTSSQEDADVHRSYQLGANSYIVKPVNFEKFAEAVSDLGFYWLMLNQPPIPSPCP